MSTSVRKAVLITALLLCYTLLVAPGQPSAQQVFGFSAGYEYFPYVELADPDPNLPGFEIEAVTRSVGAAFPMVFSGGKILVLNGLSYRRVDFRYKNFPAGGTEIEQAQSIEYSAFVIDSLSEQWKLVAVLTPGLASDFEGDLSGDDITFQGILGLLRQHRKNLALGFGVAYVRDFGTPLPLPFIYFDWNLSSKLRANGILPTNLDVRYRLTRRFDLGFSLKVLGNRYHGDPGRFNVDNPQLEYSEGTVSPMVSIHVSKWAHLNIEGGYAFYRNFEFLDGDTSAASYDLKRTGYLRTQLILGL